MNGAQYLCQILQRKGVEYIFGLFGDIQTDFAHAVRESSMHWIGVHNEKSGGFMADIYARVSGKPGIIFTTLGPGATNVVSALANATHDRSPLIAISDQVPLEEFHPDTHQYIDLEKAFAKETGITKYTAVVKKIWDLSRIFETAFTIANTEPKGAVHISIPITIFREKIGRPKYIRNYFKQKYPKSTLTYRQLLHRLRTRKRGIVIAGGSIERMSTQPQFRSFIEKYKLPVLTTFRGKNAIPSDHPNCLGTISRHLSSVISKVFNQVGFILTIGYDYNEGVKPTIWKGREKDLINIDIFDNRIKKVFYPPSLFGSLLKIFNKLVLEKAPKYIDDFDFVGTRQKIKQIIDEALDVENPKLHPRRITDAVNRLYGDNAIIVCDVGLNKYYSGLLLKTTASNRILFSNGQSAMAFSSGALGAKIASPTKDVVVLVGDGGFLMDCQEVITAVENKKIIVWIIFNNGGLGLIEQAQLKEGAEAHGVHFSKIFFAKLAEAFGLIGHRVEAEKNVYTVLHKVKEQKKVAIIDVVVEYTPRRKSY